MYCEKCGEKNKNESKYCVKCGASLTGKVKIVDNNELNNIKIISILSLVCAFLVFPVGIVLSIIGLVKAKKYQKQTGEKVGYKAFSIAALIVSIFELLVLIFVLVIIVGVFSLVGILDSGFEGSYKCKSTYSNSYVVSATFDDNKMTWAKYGYENDNVLKANYLVNSRKFDNDKSTYELKVTPYYYMVNGKLSNNYLKNTNVDIDVEYDDVTITFGNGSKYYCDKVDD